ncbi:hypothetical protein KC865_01955 [Candidatus Kaiserbacteria bacterium]|nr:hypothetical protein [Candidatus Kaiserbacteria bacterium]
MRIAILTPLFPPDTTYSAEYTKELAFRLSIKHDVTIVLYGHLPEKINSVHMECVDKRLSPIARAISFLRALQKIPPKQELILIQNGPSVELPTLIKFFFRKIPIILMESDKPALKRTRSNLFQRFIHGILEKKAVYVFAEKDPWPTEKPVIHPLKESPQIALGIWEMSWQRHLNELLTKNKHD